MSGNVSVNVGETFATMIVLSVTQKLKFGTDQPDISASGEKKWTAEVAVTYHAEPGMRPVSEVMSVTVTGPASIDIAAGTPVQFDRLRCGVSTPEKRENGRIAGGRLYWMAANVRPAQAGNRPLGSAGKDQAA